MGACSNDDAATALLEALCEDSRGRLAAYKLPTAIRAVAAIPKNVMGKINKKELLVLFGSDACSDGGSRSRPGR